MLRNESHDRNERKLVRTKKCPNETKIKINGKIRIVAATETYEMGHIWPTTHRFDTGSLMVQSKRDLKTCEYL